MTLSVVLDVVIGMAFVYFLMCIFVSGVNEWIAQSTGRRGVFLRRALIRLIGDESIYRRFMQHPLIGSLYRERAAVGKPPSYISGSSFATAIVDVVLKRAGRLGGSELPTNPDGLREALQILEANEQGIATALLPIVNSAQGEWQRTLAAIEEWFNAGMDRASGWYKARTRWVLFFIGLAVAVLANVDSIQLVHALWNSPQLRASIADEASNAVTSGKSGDVVLNDVLKRPPTPEETARIAATFRNMEANQLPIGFSCLGPDPLEPTATVLDRCSKQLTAELRGQWGLKLLGWLITALAVSLGAPFWFQLLSRLVDLRGSGNKPDAKSGSALTSR